MMNDTPRLGLCALPSFVIALSTWAGAALADPPDITSVTAQRSAAMGWRFDVTLSHPDTGWDHYADGWQVELADGTVLGARELHHPHVDEQPFTRSLSSVMLPDGTRQVFIRAHCSKDDHSAAVAVEVAP